MYKSSLLLCTGGNPTVWCGTGSARLRWSFFFWLACFTHLYPYFLSYSCCFLVMFVYLRLIWMDRARAHLALPHLTSHHTLILNLLDGFHFFLSGGEERRCLFCLNQKNCLPLSSYKCLYFKIGYFIYLSQKNSMCCMLYMYQKDKKKGCFFPTQFHWHVLISSLK